jgi:hypothetical protein
MFQRRTVVLLLVLMTSLVLPTLARAQGRLELRACNKGPVPLQVVVAMPTSRRIRSDHVSRYRWVRCGRQGDIAHRHGFRESGGPCPQEAEQGHELVTEARVVFEKHPLQGTAFEVSDRIAWTRGRRALFDRLKDLFFCAWGKVYDELRPFAVCDLSI